MEGDGQAQEAPVASQPPAGMLAAMTSAARAELDALRARNQESHRLLTSSRVNLEPSAVLLTRLEGLIDALFPRDSYERVLLDLEFERAMAEHLDKARENLGSYQEELRKQMLLRGVSQMSGHLGSKG